VLLICSKIKSKCVDVSIKLDAAISLTLTFFQGLCLLSLVVGITSAVVAAFQPDESKCFFEQERL
jgi:hypothetical protein